MLMNLLNSHPHVGCNSDSDTSDILRYGKEWTYKVGFDSEKSTKGFLLKIKTGLHKKIRTNEKIKIIYLKRDNLLDIYLSTAMSQLFGCYEKKERGIDLKDAVKVRENMKPIGLHKENLINFFKFWDDQHKKTQKILESSQLNIIKINYSDLCNNQEKTMEKIYDFLEIENSLPHFTSGRGKEKLDPRKISFSIRNYSELKRAFESTPWIEFFKD